MSLQKKAERLFFNRKPSLSFLYRINTQKGNKKKIKNGQIEQK